jgi:uncharacterized protein (TIGR04255 family)
MKGFIEQTAVGSRVSGFGLPVSQLSHTIGRDMISKTTFANPPAVEVKAAVQFANNLRVADGRAAFHELIKKEFPIVVMPDQKPLQFDFGDYTLYTENQVYRLEISMNYFRLVATKYAGFQDFRQMYLAALSIFARHYRLPTFNSLAFIYSNKVSIPPGATFDECFAVKIEVPQQLGVSIYAGRGTLVFKEKDDLILLEIDPQFSGEALDSYGLNLTYASQQPMVSSAEQSVISAALDRGHVRLTDFFFAILQPKLIEHLKTR